MEERAKVWAFEADGLWQPGSVVKKTATAGGGFEIEVELDVGAIRRYTISVNAEDDNKHLKLRNVAGQVSCSAILQGSHHLSNKQLNTEDSAPQLSSPVFCCRSLFLFFHHHAEEEVMSKSCKGSLLGGGGRGNAVPSATLYIENTTIFPSSYPRGTPSLLTVLYPFQSWTAVLPEEAHIAKKYLEFPRNDRNARAPSPCAPFHGTGVRTGVHRYHFDRFGGRRGGEPSTEACCWSSGPRALLNGYRSIFTLCCPQNIYRTKLTWETPRKRVLCAGANRGSFNNPGQFFTCSYLDPIVEIVRFSRKCSVARK